MEPVVALLKKVPKKLDWADIKAELKTTDFVPRVIKFDKDDIPPKVKDFIQNGYLAESKRDIFNVDAIHRASQAAGPLALWVKSIVEYSQIFHSIEPLRAELAELEVDE
jgi:dynein heavy chain 1